MAVVGPGMGDPWQVTPDERKKHDDQFALLKPVSGFITGEQAKGFFLQSQLPLLILGQIWALADANADGKMDRNEFSVAMKLIQMKLKGFEVPKTLPPTLKMVLAPSVMGGLPGAMGMPPSSGIAPVVGTGIPTVAVPSSGIGGPMYPQPPVSGVMSMGGGFARSASPVDVKTQRSASVTSQDSPTGSATSPLQEWAVPHQSKLKYTQHFNTNDRTRTGYLTGPQARNILMQSGLPQNILAQIWALSDIDNDGKLTCEEFCLCMHLADCVRAGDKLPAALPPELVPPSYRRSRSSSIQGGPAVVQGVPIQGPGVNELIGGNIDPKDFDKHQQMMATFEDKRKENFEKGQAELEKRRQALLENQRREQEERERKEREEQEKRERIRQEQERRRQMELEKQLAKQRELEQEKEEQRRKQMEQREAARREMERQRQLEWEKQRRQDLMTQRQKEQESLLQLKAKRQTLNIELEQLNEKVKELNGKLSDARNGVNNLKGVIDQMRTTRDKKVTEFETLKTQTKSNNQKLFLLNQEKTLLQNQMKTGLTGNPTVESHNIVMHSFNNKQITLNQLKEKLTSLEQETSQKLQDIDNNNCQLNDLKTQLTDLVNEGEKSFEAYKEKRQQVLELRKEKGLSMAPARPPQPHAESTGNDAWGTTTEWNDAPAAEDAWNATTETWPAADADAAWQENAAPADWGTDTQQQPPADWGASSDEWPANDQAPEAGDWGDSSTAGETLKTPPDLTGRMIKFRALYPFEARTADELSVMPGDIIMVPEGLAHETGWLGGELKGKTGWFPEQYAEPLGADEENSGDQEETEETSPSAITGLQETVHIVGTDMKMTLTGIQEAPENAVENGVVVVEEAVTAEDAQGSAFTQVAKTTGIAGTASPVPGQGTSVEGLQAQALFPWRAKKENHLTFNKGDIIMVREQQDMWWYGELQGKAGWFPKSYVKLIAGPMKVGEASPQMEDAGNDEEVLEAKTPFTEYYEAIYAYLSNEHGDLSFNQGDVIMVTKKDGDWWTGIIGDRVGVFPSNYVKETTNQTAKANSSSSDTVKLQVKGGSKKPDIAMVIAPYQATGPEQLSLQRGQLIQIRKKSQNGWWEGELQAKGKKRQVGWFPASYVKPLTSSARNTPEPTGSAEQVMAMYQYDAQNEDELSFQKGSIITIVSKDDGAWWKGEFNGSVGLFPANYVQTLDKQSSKENMSLDPMERKRQESIRELINTEQNYFDDMAIVMDVFYRPLKEAKVLTDQELDVVFVNWKELIACNTKLLKAFRVRKKLSDNGVLPVIGDILCENLPHMAPYIRFCSCQLNAAALIQSKTEKNPEFKTVAKGCCRDPRTKGMPLSSFLLKPMQRITKYPLLIKKIIDYTPINHPDRPQLEDALAKAEEICNQVNEGVREKENSDRLEWIQHHVHCDALVEKITFNSLTNSLGPRKFLHSGILIKAKSNKELAAFLFNDFLLLTQPQKIISNISSTVINFDKTASIQFKMYKQPLFLNEIMIKPSQDADDDVYFQINHIDRTYNLKASSLTEKNLWVKKLEETSRHYIETERKKREKAHSTKAQRTSGVGRLLVVVVEGINLKAKSNGQSDPYCEVSMGAQEHRTKVVADSINPKWNANMQFIVKDLQQDLLCITIFDREYFSPDDFLGRTEVRVADVAKETRKTKEPLVRRLPLYEVDRGEVVVKLDLQLFDSM